MANNTADRFGIQRFGSKIPRGHITIKEMCARCEMSLAEFQRQNTKGAFAGNELVYFGFDGEDDSLFENKSQNYVDWEDALPILLERLTTNMYNRTIRSLRLYGFDEKGRALFPEVGVVRIGDRDITQYLSSQKGKKVLDSPLKTGHGFLSRNINEPPQRKCGAAIIKKFWDLVEGTTTDKSTDSLGGGGEAVNFEKLLDNIDYNNPREVEKATHIIKMRETYNKAMLSEIKYQNESNQNVNLGEVKILIETSVVALRSGVSQAVIKMVEDFVGNIITQLSEYDPTIARHAKHIDRKDLQEILRSDFDDALEVMSQMFERKADDIEEEEEDE